MIHHKSRSPYYATMHSIDVTGCRSFLRHARICPQEEEMNPSGVGSLNTPMCLSRAAAMCEITVPLRLRQCRSDNQKHLLCRRLQGGKKTNYKL